MSLFGLNLSGLFGGGGSGVTIILVPSPSFKVRLAAPVILRGKIAFQ